MLHSKYCHECKEFKQVDFKARLKGIYPYEFTDSWEEFDSDKILNQEDFYDDLNQKTISEQEYE
jgi:hypothetical protein